MNDNTPPVIVCGYGSTVMSHNPFIYYMPWIGGLDTMFDIDAFFNGE